MDKTKIYITRGDDTNFNNYKFLTFNINTEIDITGWSAVFTLGGVSYTFDNIESKTFSLTLSAEDTRKIPYGNNEGLLYLYDSDKRRKLISNSIPFYVTKNPTGNTEETINVEVPTNVDMNISINLGGSKQVTKTSELENDSGFITKDVEDLTYYSTTTEVNELLKDKINTSEKGAANGVATLNEDGKIPIEQIDIENSIINDNTVSATSTYSSNKIEEIASTKANEDNVVHKTGDETISGEKTFSGNTTLGGYFTTVTSNSLDIKSSGSTMVIRNQGPNDKDPEVLIARYYTGDTSELDIGNAVRAINIRPNGAIVPTNQVTIYRSGQVKANEFVGDLKGNADTATNSSNDGDGNNIVATYANQEFSNLGEDAENRLTVSKAYMADSIYTDTKLYNQLVNQKHSTFDKSKFTVVGSPTITDDGVASGFSNGNYLQNTLNYTYTNNTILYLPFKTGSDIVTTQRIYFKENPNNAIAINNNTIVIIWEDVNSNAISTGWMSNIIETNKEYVAKIEDNGIKQIISILNVASGVWKVLKEQNKISNLNLQGVLTTGLSTVTQQPFLGSIDLKQFSITVDGKEVFSGNKTGIDTIKPDDYTVVGTPTISADGVASGFSRGNYLTTTQTLGNSIKVFSTFKTPQSDNVTANSAIWQIKTSSTIELQVVGQKMFIINSGGTISAGNFNFEYDTWYDTIFEYNFTTGAYKLSYKKSADNNYIELTGTQSGWVNMSLSDIVIDFGTMNRYYWYTGGSIDLNAFKIYVNGNLIYQPCLKIPYTESKTGSKIVDSKYRERVFDTYEQEGIAMYYTLDTNEHNFTLPLGDIYGMMTKLFNKVQENGG